MGRWLIGVGLLIAVAGVVVLLLERVGLSPGRLPGDFTVRGRGWTLFAPLGTSILLSVLLSLLLYVVTRLRR